jgi:hypothetical protein
MNTLNLVRATDKIENLTGVGLEYLTDSDGVWIRAVFLDGKMSPDLNHPVLGNRDKTDLIQAA